MQIKKLLVVGFVFLFVALGAYYLFGKKNQPPEQKPATPSPRVLYRSISPGLTSGAEVINVLGKPIREESGQLTSTLVYPSNEKERPLLIDTGQNNTVYRIVEPLGQSTGFSEAIKNLGTVDSVLYGPFYDAGFELHVFLARGIAILGNPKTNKSWQRWYFKPMPLSLFLTTIAPDYKKEPVVGQP